MSFLGELLSLLWTALHSAYTFYSQLTGIQNELLAITLGVPVILVPIVAITFKGIRIFSSKNQIFN